MINNSTVIGARIYWFTIELLAKHKYINGIDKDQKKIDLINKKKIPFIEYGLEKIIKKKKSKN